MQYLPMLLYSADPPAAQVTWKNKNASRFESKRAFVCLFYLFIYSLLGKKMRPLPQIFLLSV
jgi:hypothetical protein